MNKIQLKSEGDIQLYGLIQQREREDMTVMHVFDIVNLAMVPLGIDSLM